MRGQQQQELLGLEQFGVTPVAAGPFMVVSDILNTKLVLKRNPHYWEKGKPYLDSLTFKGAGLQVTPDKGNGSLDVQLNTAVAPFTNLKARQAIYYATDNQTIG